MCDWAFCPEGRLSRPARLPACLPLSISLVSVSQQIRRNLSFLRHKLELYLCLSFAPPPPPTFQPTNKSAFWRTNSAPWNLETTSEVHEQKCEKRLTRRSTYLLVWCQGWQGVKRKLREIRQNKRTHTCRHTHTHAHTLIQDTNVFYFTGIECTHISIRVLWWMWWNGG